MDIETHFITRLEPKYNSTKLAGNTAGVLIIEVITKKKIDQLILWYMDKGLEPLIEENNCIWQLELKSEIKKYHSIENICLLQPGISFLAKSIVVQLCEVTRVDGLLICSL